MTLYRGLFKNGSPNGAGKYTYMLPPRKVKHHFHLTMYDYKGGVLRGRRNGSGVLTAYREKKFIIQSDMFKLAYFTKFEGTFKKNLFASGMLVLESCIIIAESWQNNMPVG